MTSSPPADLILIIEDDRKTASLISRYLEREGFPTLIAADGRQGLAMARLHHPILIVLDLMLPLMDGWEVCRQIRQSSDVPIVMLTARDEEVDLVSGLTLGADDYVRKPFSPRELVARIKAVLRRGRRPREEHRQAYLFSGLALDAEKHTVTLHGNPVFLTLHEFKLLQALMASPGRVFTREELIAILYPGEGASVVDRVVDVHIGKLRQKIEKDPARPRYVITVRGVGYRLAEGDKPE